VSRVLNNTFLDVFRSQMIAVVPSVPQTRPIRLGLCAQALPFAGLYTGDTVIRNSPLRSIAARPESKFELVTTRPFSVKAESWSTNIKARDIKQQTEQSINQHHQPTNGLDREIAERLHPFAWLIL